MSKEQIAGWVIALTGLIVLVLTVFADQLGFGYAAGAFSAEQVMAALAGVAILIIGVVFIFRQDADG